MGERLVVIGGDAAGMTAASAARRLNADLEIVALERGEYTSYSACGIPYFVAGIVEEIDDLVARTPQEFRDLHRIDARILHEVLSIDPASNQVEVLDHAHGRTFQLGYDQLMIGTGGNPIRPDLPGIDLPHVHGVQNLGDAERLMAYAEENDCESVVVVGAGYIGLEMAEAFTLWGADVTVIDQGPEVMASLDPDIGRLVRQAMLRHNITIRSGVAAEGFEERSVIVEGEHMPADLVVLGIGVVPNSALAVAAGLDTGVKDAIRVNRRQQTSVPNIWAAGDCAEVYHRVTDQPTHIPLGTHANKAGLVAGTNIGGSYATFPGVVGTAISKFCSAEVSRTGLSTKEAERAGFVVASATIESTTKAGYYPGARPLTVKLIGECGSGRILGGQIVGEESSAKRIDTLATAITAGFSAQDLVDTDLSYAPPFSGVWDPVQVAARHLVDALS